MPWIVGKSGLHLPAVKRSAVVGQVDADAAHHAGREPGLTTGMPCRQSGQSSGWCASTCRVASATRGTPTSALPPLRSMMEPAASTRAPAARSTSITSRVLPPVVMTSSTTTAISPGSTVKPRRRDILRVSGSRSVNRNGVPSARATSCPMIRSAQGGRNHEADFFACMMLAQFFGQQASEAFGGRRMAQHQRALQIFAAVQSAGEAEMALQVGAGGTEQIEDRLGLRRHKGLLYH